MYDDERKKGNATDLVEGKKNFEMEIDGLNTSNESLNVQGNTNFRFNENEEESKVTKVKSEVDESKDLSVNDGSRERRELLDGMSKDEELLDETSEIKHGLKEHAKLLDEAPKVVEDVVDEEINARFNEETEKQQNNEEKVEVEVEVPEFDYVEELTEDDNGSDIGRREISFLQERTNTSCVCVEVRDKS